MPVSQINTSVEKYLEKQDLVKICCLDITRECQTRHKRFSCVLKMYGSDNPILQEEVSMLKTICLTIYKVMELYEGRENIYVPNKLYVSSRHSRLIIIHTEDILLIYYRVLFFCNKH